jgi:hypothetical protein
LFSRLLSANKQENSRIPDAGGFIVAGAATTKQSQEGQQKWKD